LFYSKRQTLFVIGELGSWEEELGRLRRPTSLGLCDSLRDSGLAHQPAALPILCHLTVVANP
jgi:hypothetical protein